VDGVKTAADRVVHGALRRIDGQDDFARACRRGRLWRAVSSAGRMQHGQTEYRGTYREISPDCLRTHIVLLGRNETPAKQRSRLRKMPRRSRADVYREEPAK
jgi:hypothetical protein